MVFRAVVLLGFLAIVALLLLDMPELGMLAFVMSLALRGFIFTFQKSEQHAK